MAVSRRTQANVHIKKWDRLLITGLCLAAMTDLRIWKVGPAELFCLIWGLKFFPRRVYRFNTISIFFAGFMGAMLVGSLIGYAVAPSELSVSDLVTWLYLAFIALAFYEGLKDNNVEYNEHLFSCFCFAAASWYLFLYLYSILFNKTFLGARLWYSNIRFSGGGKNPHQVAVVMCGITFGFIRNIIKRRAVYRNLLGAITAIFLELQTRSSTGFLSILISFLALMMIITFYRYESTTTKFSIMSVELIAGIIILIIVYPAIYKRFYNWLASDSNGLGRLELFRQIGATFKKSPLFGLGPGVHALWGIHPKEFHNTYLEILAASGLAGSFCFISMTVKVIKKLLVDATLLPIMISIYAYGLAGFAMRRIAYWGIVVFIFLIADGILSEKQAEERNEVL